ncbi:MAG: hypothetical protein SGPRY_006969, partial [Prymnesium sp.]
GASAVAHHGGEIRVWDVEGGRMMSSFAAHDGPAHTCAHMEGVGLLASAGMDGGIFLWDMRQPRPVSRAHTGHAVYALTPHPPPHPNALLSAGHDGMVRLWDVRGGRLSAVLTLQAHKAPVRALVVEGRKEGRWEGRAVWSGSTDGTVRCWELAQLQLSSNRANRQVSGTFSK